MQPNLLEKIKAKQVGDEKLQKIRGDVQGSRTEEFSSDSNGILRFKGWLCVLNDPKIHEEILREAHQSIYTIHPSGTKMYKDLKVYFWWPGMKGDIGRFVAQCLTCQQVKAEH